NAHFGGALSFSNPTGNTLEVLDDGGAGTTDVNSLSVTQTATSLANGSPAIGLFTDGTTPFTNAFTSAGSETTGFAGRIVVNPAILGDPSKLTLFDTSTAVGDPTRPNFIFNQLTGASFSYSAQTGFGTVTQPFSGTVQTFLRQLLSQQGQNAANASN